MTRAERQKIRRFFSVLLGSLLLASIASADTKKNAIDDTSNLVESQNLIWQMLKKPSSSYDKKTAQTAKEKFPGKSLTSKFELEILRKSNQIGKVPPPSPSRVHYGSHSIDNKANSLAINNKTNQAVSNSTENGTDYPSPAPSSSRDPQGGAHSLEETPVILSGASIEQTSPTLAPIEQQDGSLSSGFLLTKEQARYPSSSRRHSRPFVSAEDPFRLTDIFHDEHFNKLLSTDSSSFREREGKNLQSFRSLHRIYFKPKDHSQASHSDFDTKGTDSLYSKEKTTVASKNFEGTSNKQISTTPPPSLVDPKAKVSKGNSLPLPIYEEISGALHIDTSIDDILDEFIHPKSTENNDQYLYSVNGSYKNLLEPELSLNFRNSLQDNFQNRGDQSSEQDSEDSKGKDAKPLIQANNIVEDKFTQKNQTDIKSKYDFDTHESSMNIVDSTTTDMPLDLETFAVKVSNFTQPIESFTDSPLRSTTDEDSTTLGMNEPTSMINDSQFLIRDRVETTLVNGHKLLNKSITDNSKQILSLQNKNFLRQDIANVSPNMTLKRSSSSSSASLNSEIPKLRNASSNQEVPLKSDDSENLYYSLFGYNEHRRKNRKRGKLTVEAHNKMVLEAQAERMLLVMNQSADPCTDFYEYACGKWSQVYPLEDKALDNTFDRLREGLDEVLKTLLEEEITPSDSKATTAAKILYRGCLNMDEIENQGTAPLLSLLQELGGWPVLEGSNWKEEDFDWVRMMAKLRTYNNDVFLSEWVAADISNSSYHVIQLDQPELGLPSREYFLSPGDEPYRKAYLELMLKSCELLGADSFFALTEMLEVIDFEKEIARILTPAEERRNLSAVHKRFTVDQLQKEIPEVNWKAYLGIVAGQYASQAQEVIIFALEYIKKLVFLIQTSKKRTVSNYLLWRFVKNRISNLGEEALEAKQKFIQTLFGSKSQPERWLSCVSYVNGNLGYVVGALFVEKYYPASSKSDSEEMINLIRKSFTSAIGDATWMHERTREIAIDKVYAMIRNVGYPEYILNATYMNEIYSGLNFDENTHFWNVIEMLRFHATSTHQLLLKPVNRKEWTTTPAVVNAYYSRSKNMIMFPAGILQPPFYHPAFPRCLNFGGVGVVIGHEISHGFDDRGRQFDRNGNLQQWWTKDDVSHFYDRATCMLVQYGEYEVSSVGLNINSVNTLSENIADNAGLKIAYKAYQQWKSIFQGDEVHLPNITLTHDQLFFLNFGQIWCEVNSPEAMLTKLRGGQHSPNRYRVIGTLSNSQDFSEAFHCPVGSPMNPKEKCSVW